MGLRQILLFIRLCYKIQFINNYRETLLEDTCVRVFKAYTEKKTHVLELSPRASQQLFFGFLFRNVKTPLKRDHTKSKFSTQFFLIKSILVRRRGMRLDFWEFVLK